MVVARGIADMKFKRDAGEKSFNVLLRKPVACLKCESVLTGMQQA
jgi:hypothetical protein